MKQRNFFISLLLAFSLPFFAFANPVTSPAKPASIIETPPGCQLAPPTTVAVNNITPYTATASWTSVPNATWYKIRVENISVPSTPNLIQYVAAPNLSVALSSLTENTDYIVHVSATSCGIRDDYGSEQDRPFSTPAIIIDETVYLEGCKDFNLQIPVHYPPYTQLNPINFINPPLSYDMPPTTYNTYRISEGGAFIDFAVWNYQSPNGGFDTYFKDINAEGIIRTPPGSQLGGIPSISFHRTNSTVNFCTVSVIASGASFAPRLNLSFVNEGLETQFLACYKNSGPNGGGGGNFGVSIETLPTKLIANPNPLTDQTTLHYTTGKDSPVTLSLYNSTGTLVKTILNKVWTEAGNQETLVEMSDLPNGLYFVTLETNEGRQVSTLVKTN